jgi:membrane protein YdbS with pleckstrin-like domain
MQPPQGESGPLAERAARIPTPIDDTHDTHDTKEFPQVTMRPQPLVSPPPAELAGMLLPTEAVTFASTPHPVILVRPVVEIAVICVLLLTVLAWETHPIVRGHHVTVPLVTGYARLAVGAVAGLLILRALGSLVARAWRYFGYRVVSTNRRVFVVTGVFGRNVTPLGNTGLAGATMSQGPLGRIFGYGTIAFSNGTSTMRDMRDPVHLYREFEAVANGVDGDTWTPAVRQTLIP